MKGSSPSNEHSSLLYLNVYDLTPHNGYMYWLGLGIYHSAVEAYGVEYAFGAHDFPSTGVFEVEPRSCPGFTFRKSVPLGTIKLSPKEFRKFVVDIANEYHGDSYHLIAKNCNHFCDDVCVRLTGHSIPAWINRLARLGHLCNCLLPCSLRVSAVHRALKGQIEQGEGIGACHMYGRLTDSFVPTASETTRKRRSPSMFLKSAFPAGGLIPRNLSNSRIFSRKD